MTRWITPSLDQLKSDCGEYTLAYTIVGEGRSVTQKFPKKADAVLRRDELRKNGDSAFVFDPNGCLV
jgi:hypothetical protein